jgi:hypothetical protein
VEGLRGQPASGEAARVRNGSEWSASPPQRSLDLVRGAVGAERLGLPLDDHTLHRGGGVDAAVSACVEPSCPAGRGLRQPAPADAPNRRQASWLG